MSYLEGEINRIGDCLWQRGVKGGIQLLGLVEYNYLLDGDFGGERSMLSWSVRSRLDRCLEGRQIGSYSLEDRLKWF